jgi:hypothetical protein
MLADITDVFAALFGEAPDEILHQQWDIFRWLAERRNGDRKNIQPVEEILAEGSGSHGSPQVTIGCGYETDIY